MNPTQRKIVGKYIRWVADELGLRDWTFNIMHDPVDDSFATIKPVFGRRVADFWFCDDFDIQDLEVQREIIIHELLHCHWSMMQWAMEKYLEGQVAQPAFDVFMVHYRQVHEVAIDSLAHSISKHYPLIDWKGKATPGRALSDHVEKTPNP